MKNKSSLLTSTHWVTTIFCFCLAAQAWGQTSIASPDSILLGSFANYNHQLTDTIEVTADGDWTVTVPEDVDWLTLDTVHGDGSNFTLAGNHSDSIYTLNGNGNGRFTIRGLHNSGGPEREADITVSTGSVTDSVHVWQDWGAVIVNGVKYGRSNPQIPLDTSVGVVSKEPKYSGNLIVPPTMVYQGVTYKVEAILGAAFQNCTGLISVIIPNSVAVFGAYVFSGCTGLSSLEVGWSTPVNANDAFTGVGGITGNYGNATLIVPQGTVELYESADVWTDFNKIVEKVSPDSLSFVAEGTVGELTDSIFITTNVAWEITAKAAWLTVEPMSGTGNDTLVVTTAASDTGAERTGGFTFANQISNGTNDSVRVKVTQQAVSTFEVSADTLFFDAEYPQAATVRVTAYADWSVSEDYTWISLAPLVPSGNVPQTFGVVVQPNKSNMPREGEIIVTKGDSNKTIVVKQAAYVPYIHISGDNLSFKKWGEDKTVNITSNLAWTIKVDADVEDETSWLTVAPMSGSGNKVLTVTAKTNMGEERRGTITISSAIGDSVIAVAQDAVGAPHLILSPVNLSFDDSIGVKTVSVMANIAWGVTVLPEGADWLTLTPTSPSGKSSRNFTVQVAPNAGAEREATIVVAPDDNDDVDAQTILVAQDANTSGILLSPGSISFEADEPEAKLVSVTVEGGYTARVAEGDYWITLDPEFPAGNITGSFNVAATSNDTGFERSGSIIVESGDTSILYYVAQASGPYVRFSADVLFFESNESLTQDLTVFSNSDWEIGANVSWLTLSAKTGSGVETLRATATPNTGEAREGTITVRSFDKSFNVHVAQEATRAFRFKGSDGDIYYYAPDKLGTTVEVADAGEGGGYSGNITIPAIATDPETNKTYDVTEIGSRAFSYCDNLVSVRIPYSVKQIGEWAFSNCTNLASVEIPGSVEKIMNGAFSGCSNLASISIPQSVTVLACMAFYECSSLATMHVYWQTPPQLPNINPDFTDYINCTLYVPAGKKRDYHREWYWADFVDIIERDATAADKVSAESAVAVRASSGRLYVDSPSAETIYIYSFTGQLLHTASKASGKAVFDLPTEKLLIVRGSSGWAKKFTNY
jgi:hypothetical protein